MPVDSLLETKKERIQNFKETRDWRYIYLNKLDETCFQHGVTLHSSFIDNIWGADFANMQIKSNKGILFVLCVMCYWFIRTLRHKICKYMTSGIKNCAYL